jgi:hypothetical protein
MDSSRMMIIIKNLFTRIVSYKDYFDGYVTNTRHIMIWIVLNRRDVSGRTVEYMHPSLACTSFIPCSG